MEHGSRVALTIEDVHTVCARPAKRLQPASVHTAAFTPFHTNSMSPVRLLGNLESGHAYKSTSYQDCYQQLPRPQRHAMVGNQRLCMKYH